MDQDLLMRALVAAMALGYAALVAGSLASEARYLVWRGWHERHGGAGASEHHDPGADGTGVIDPL